MLRISGRTPIDRTRIQRVMVRATNWVGDVVMTLPALEAVRANFPSSSITVLARPWVIPLLEHHPAVDRVLPLGKGRGPAGLLRAAAEIRRNRFDLAVLFQNAFEAALLARLGGVRHRLGYNTDGRRWLLTHAVIRDDDVLKRHQVEYYLAILEAAGWEAPVRDPRLFVSEADRRTVDALLQARGAAPGEFLVGLSPGAVFGPAKRWPPERFARVGDWAAERWGARVLVMGSPSEQDICGRVTGAMEQRGLDLCGATTLGEAMALIERCRLFVTNDSGLMHVAAALGVPLVAVFGSTDPHATGPRGPRARVVRQPISCAPCLKPTCTRGYECLLAVEPEDVWREMEALKEACP